MSRYTVAFVHRVGTGSLASEVVTRHRWPFRPPGATEYPAVVSTR
jgi:hypothetical protein